MFAEPVLSPSQLHRGGAPILLSEVVATAGLLFVIVTLARTSRLQHVAWAVGAWIGAAYWFTASTSFANPAATIGRTLTNTYAGIAPASAPAFIATPVPSTPASATKTGISPTLRISTWQQSVPSVMTSPGAFGNCLPTWWTHRKILDSRRGVSPPPGARAGHPPTPPRRSPPSRSYGWNPPSIQSRKS
jgi:hypothetical protein